MIESNRRSSRSEVASEYSMATTARTTRKRRRFFMVLVCFLSELSENCHVRHTVSLFIGREG